MSTLSLKAEMSQVEEAIVGEISDEGMWGGSQGGGGQAGNQPVEGV